MKQISLRSTSAFCAAGLLGLWGALPLQAAEKPDFKAIAERVVGQSVNVKEGDRVLINGDVRDIDLIEEVALAVWKRGAEPVQIVTREKAMRRYYDEVPKKYDALPLSFSLKLAEAETVDIAIGGQELPTLLSDVDPNRLTVTGNRMSDFWSAERKRGVRSVWLGNFLYPTEATARQYGITREQLADIFWTGINVDYNQLQATATALRAILTSGKEVRLTNPNGTDLKLRIEGRSSFANDGVVSAEDVALGGPALSVSLPAGEVFVTPVPGTAEGKLVLDAMPFEAGTVFGVTLTVKGGKLTAHSAQPSPDYDRWKALYEAAPEGKNEFGALDIGINGNIKLPAGGKVVFSPSAGVVTPGFGGNTWAGGSTEMMWYAGGPIKDCTVTVDGKLIVDKGVLKVR